VNRLSRTCVIAALAAAQLAAGLGGYATAATDGRVRTAATAADPLVERLEAAGLRVISEQTLPAHRFFMLGYRQPIDHLHPWKGSFEQRLTLLHRGEDRPMVLHGSGYNVPDVPFRSEPARLVDGNQISVEHRYFTPSRPQPTDWNKLTIWQSATDYHRIVGALKGVYAGKWLSTGGSKGGMTSVYFRRFYPRDVDATVAYVAPNDVIDSRDVYERFLDNVGTGPACRDRLTAIQRETLLRRDELVARMTTWAQAQGYTYTGLFGSADRALEFMVVDTAFAFWQYQLQADCATVPAADVSTDQLWAFLDKVDGFAFYTDQGIEPYVPYYFQAGTQLGSPAPAERHLRDLLRYPGGSVPRSFVPADIPMRFHPLAMVDVDTWVRWAGRSLMFVYGENDPWSAEPFRLGPGTRDSFSYTVRGGNHGSRIAQLPEEQRTTATATIMRWAGVPAAPIQALAAAPSFIPGLDDVNVDQVRRPL
jgi:PS-10 peptidase S37